MNAASESPTAKAKRRHAWLAAGHRKDSGPRNQKRQDSRGRTLACQLGLDHTGPFTPETGDALTRLLHSPIPRSSTG